MGLLGVYDYTVVLTYIGTVVAFLGMGYAVDGGKMHIFTALVCLMISGFCDMFDGKIASTKKNRTPQQKKFGVQIDSLSDLVCFGVLPSIIVYQLKVGSKLEFAISAFYMMCGLIRLAYFNVEEEERTSQTDARRTEFRGMPITSAALWFPGFYALAVLLQTYANSALDPSVIISILAILVGIAFITPFKLTKPGFVGKIVMILIGVVDVALMVWAAISIGWFE